MTRVVVLGGGFAGVLAAMVFARHADEVTLVEGGRYPAAPGVRSGLPQAHHSHLLVTGGARALDELIPGTVAALLAHGAYRRDLSGDTLIRSAQGWFTRYATGAHLISCSRWLTDYVVRERALSGGAVTVREDTQVAGLTGDADRVTGVRICGPDGRPDTIPADLVVDTAGRRSQATRWLAGIGGDAVEEEIVDPGLAYATRIYRAPPGLSDIPAIMIHPDPAPGRPGHGATVFPIEEGRWIVTLTGTRHSRPPVDEEGFVASASALPSPIVAELMSVATPLGGVRPHRATANRRRFFERGSRPAGFLVLGDALIAVNPVYSHGMSIAAMTIRALAGELGRFGVDPQACPRWQALIAAEGDRSWQMAIEQDVAARTALGGPAVSRDRLAMHALLAGASLRSPRLMTELFRRQTLDTGDSAVTETTVPLGPPLSAEEAIRQYPALSGFRSPRPRSYAHVRRHP